jgi:hypothetical protein
LAHGHPVDGNDLERINRRIVRQGNTDTPSTYASVGFSKSWVTLMRIEEALQLNLRKHKPRRQRRGGPGRLNP